MFILMQMGHGVSVLLKAILEFFPLDSYVESPVSLMEVVPGDPARPVIWEEYRRIIQESGDPAFRDFGHFERFAFYDGAMEAFSVVATGEGALYANIILKKGVVSG